jgi:hypothetical protein
LKAVALGCVAERELDVRFAFRLFAEVSRTAAKS